VAARWRGVVRPMRLVRLDRVVCVSALQNKLQKQEQQSTNATERCVSSRHALRVAFVGRGCEAVSASRVCGRDHLMSGGSKGTTRYGRDAGFSAESTQQLLQQQEREIQGEARAPPRVGLLRLADVSCAALQSKTMCSSRLARVWIV
jgi:hypothetical protein